MQDDSPDEDSSQGRISSSSSTTSSSRSSIARNKTVTPISAAFESLTVEQVEAFRLRGSAGIKILEPDEFSTVSETDAETLPEPPSPEFPHVGKGKGIDPSERPQMPTVDEKDVTAEEDVTAEDGGDGEQDPGADEYINDEDDEEDEDSEDDEDGENNDANPRKAIFCVSDIFSDYMLQN